MEDALRCAASADAHRWTCATSSLAVMIAGVQNSYCFLLYATRSRLLRCSVSADTVHGSLEGGSEDGCKRAACAAPRVLPALGHGRRDQITGEHENPEGVRRSRPTSHAAATRAGSAAALRRAGPHQFTALRREPPPNQIRERDWQPSTGTLAPLIQLARGDTRNATTAPTSSGRPNRPNGSSRVTKSAIPAGSSC